MSLRDGVTDDGVCGFMRVQTFYSNKEIFLRELIRCVRVVLVSMQDGRSGLEEIRRRDSRSVRGRGRIDIVAGGYGARDEING
jgi:hypothetical protein